MPNSKVGNRSAPKNGPAVSPKNPVNQQAVSQQAASVPISLYREVAAELQTAKVMLDSLNTQNQQLTRQNQQLRLEIERVVQVALRLRQVADSHQPVARSSSIEASSANLDVPVENPPMVAPSPGRTSGRPVAPRSEVVKAPPPKVEPPEPIPFSEELFTEEAEYPYDYRSENKADFSGWWLAILILMIVVSAFGAGFVIVRPFLPSR